LAIGVLAAACDPGFAELGSASKVTLYGRTEGPGIAWFGIDPASTGAPQIVGMTSDIGVGCLDARVGSRIVATDRPLSEGGAVTAILATVDDPTVVLWVVVGEDGDTVIGRGVPAWWTGAPQVC